MGSPPEKTKRPAHSTLHVDKTTYERVVQRKTQLHLSSINDTVVALLEHCETEERSPGLLTPEALGLEASVVETIRVAMERSEEHNFSVFLRKALVKEANIRIGTAQRYKDIDLTQLSTSALEKQQKSPQVTLERIRRAVITLMLYNQRQVNPRLRASITQNAVHEMIGVRFENIRAFLTTHQQVIAEHHTELEFPEKRSSKVDLRALVIPEEPEVFQQFFLPPRFQERGNQEEPEGFRIVEGHDG